MIFNFITKAKDLFFNTERSLLAYDNVQDAMDYM